MNNQNALEKLHTHKQKKNYFLSLTIHEQTHAILNASKFVQKQLLTTLDQKDLMQVFNHLDPDEIVDLLQLLPEKKQRKIKHNFSKKLQDKIDFLHKYSPKTAAGIMNLNYIIVEKGTTKEEIKSRINKHLKKGQKEPTILVIDSNEKLLGELRISSLLFQLEETLYDSIISLPTLSSYESQAEVLHRFKHHRSEKIVIIDSEGIILGLVKAKELIKVSEEELHKDFYGLAGLNQEEEATSTVREKVRFRLRWLIINLFAVFIAALVISYFEETIAKFVLLAAFMPIIVDLGGNVGTQATAVLIRSMALHRVGSSYVKIMLSEGGAALINGIILGTIVAGFALALGETWLFGLIAMIAVILNLVITATLGILIPVGFKKFGVDPAVASTLFITTLSDILGFAIFLGLATIFLM